MDVRRGAARLGAALLLTAGAMLMGPAALAQEADPCAPAADGSVPEMCQGGMAPEPVPSAETDPCPPQPVEPGDGVVTDEGDQGIAEGEPNPDAPPSGAPAAEGEPRPEPAPEEPVSSEPGAVGDEGIICAFGIPVSAPVDTAAGGGAAAPEAAPVTQLPRTGPYDRLLGLAAAGAGLLALGGGATLVGRRREADA
jgi:LPXTG-motif cell wall-anchored protein